MTVMRFDHFPGGRSGGWSNRMTETKIDARPGKNACDCPDPGAGLTPATGVC
jgi:hypothetical protein